MHDGRVFIGNGNGQFFALDAKTGATLWTFPPAGFPVSLTSKFTCNPSSFGIADTAAIARVKDRDVVVFGAPASWTGTPPPPPLGPGPGLGDGHLFALDTTNGHVVWISPAVATVAGFGPNQAHQQIGYSAPLVFNERVYVGIADHCDNPIQRGKVVAVHLANGAIDPAFAYESTAPAGTRGGGVWNGPAALDDVYFTTGNTRSGNPSQPATNLGLSTVRVHRNTGAPVWNWQPVPYVLDDDPDWSEGITLMHTSCGHVAVSTQKDGWTWAMNTGNGHRRWAFPDGSWTAAGFTPADGTFHGDTDYKRPGAAWGDVYIGAMGGLDTVTNLSAGYRRLHALDVCRPYDHATLDKHRVRWIKDIPSTGGFGYPLGPPTVTHGIVYVGTNQGHLVIVADPSVAPSGVVRCNDPNVPSALCTGATLRLVPDPLAKDIAIAGAGSIFGEPVLAGDRVFLADTTGHVYMLEAP